MKTDIIGCVVNSNRTHILYHIYYHMCVLNFILCIAFHCTHSITDVCYRYNCGKIRCHRLRRPVRTPVHTDIWICEASTFKWITWDDEHWYAVDDVFSSMSCSLLSVLNLQNYFRLKSPTTPEVIVNAILDYDEVKNVQLVLTVHVSNTTHSSNSLK